MTAETTAQYEVYCLADPVFYDTPGQRPQEPDFAVATRAVPDGWDHQPSDTWMYYAPPQRNLPSQGWKIHVSSCVPDADRVLDAVWEYCVPRGYAFKFLRSRPVMVMLNAKSAGRGSSGKLVTIYPENEAALQTALADLDEILRGVSGPYILSDLRYGMGPLFVRYGGFSERFCIGEDGTRTLAIENADGTLVPDVRGATFAVPPWVPLPEFLTPHLAARQAVTTTGLRYEVESALQFSNGGGVYLGRDKETGRRVVLKEGRPHAGLDLAGRDAVTRIGHERDVLQRLAGLDVVPAVYDYFVLGGHHFLVEEFVDGNPLQRLLVQRYPLSHPDGSDAALAEYVDWATGMLAMVERAVAALHGRGVVFGDLHPENILVTPAGRVVLIDFEVATLTEDSAVAALAHPAFQAPADRHGAAVDDYALACLKLGMFAPQTTVMLRFDKGKAAQLAAFVTETFPVPADLVDTAVRTITGEADHGSTSAVPVPGVDAWEQVRDSLGRAVLASATPERTDRLYPGDIAQFQPGGAINLAHGAAGVLYTLAATGVAYPPEHEKWLRERATAAAPGTPAGFYDGLHGVAHVLATLGHRQDALDLVDRANRIPVDSAELGLFSGWSGIGLNLLHLAATTGETGLADLAARVVDMVADRLGGVTDVPEISGGDHPRAGLMYGSSGPALLFLHAWEHTGDPALLDLAATALRQDLRRCHQADDGTVQVDQGWRTLPYLDEGSIGIALVLARYLRHRPGAGPTDLADTLDRLWAVTRSGYFVQPGLFTGRAGMIAATGMRGDCPAALVRGLRWHVLPYRGDLAFPGDQLLRLSMDLATGTAGVLLALGAAQPGATAALPFLTLRRPAPHDAATRRTASPEAAAPPPDPAVPAQARPVDDRSSETCGAELAFAGERHLKGGVDNGPSRPARS